MSGVSNYPTSIDDSTSLGDVTDGTSTLQAAHHNNLRASIVAMQNVLGIPGSAVATSVQYRLGHPTGGHLHDGATGNGPKVNPTAIPAPSGAIASVANLHDHFMATAAHRDTDRAVIQAFINGSAASGANRAAPITLGRTMQLENVRAVARRGPSGATATFDVNVGPTSLWAATQANRVILNPGASVGVSGTPNLVTYPSGAIITVDVDTVGSSAPTEDLSLTFVFRD